ncbi:MAG: aromatic ring-hydroxylating dioxygenase subunit alpha [Pseudomonadota bacterium]
MPVDLRRQGETAAGLPDLEALLASVQAGYSLPQAFYDHPAMLDLDLRAFLSRHWILAGHISQIPEVGDYFLFELGNESVIICRADVSSVRAHANVCRHRGSRICLEQHGQVRRLVCPYHAWSYHLDGSLAAAPRMPEDFEKSAYGLQAIRCELVEGLIFVALADDPVSFEPVRALLTRCLAPYDLPGTQVADQRSYSISGNWKLSVENYLECYHCTPAHREYARFHSDSSPREEAANRLEELLQRAASVGGLTERRVEHYGLGALDNQESLVYDRDPLYPPAVTGSETGAPLAPVLGSLTGYDGGTAYIHVGPLSYLLLYADHVILYRFTPRTAGTSQADIWWLVRGDTEEGVDFSRAELTWLWELTIQQDKTIIESNARGVSSMHYRPGPYSPFEPMVVKFQAWYLDSLRRNLPEGRGSQF